MPIRVVYYAWETRKAAGEMVSGYMKRTAMKKDLKVGVHRGDGNPEYRWNVIVLDLAFEDAMKFLDETQYQHVVDQVQELARELDPTHSKTQTVATVENFFELKDKGGPLGHINVRVFFVLDKP